MWLWMHLITWVVLLIDLVLGMFIDPKKRTPFLMIARVGYVVMIVSGYMLMSVAFNRNPALTILKVVLAIGFIGITEMSFASAGKRSFKASWRWLVLGCAVVVGVLGFVLAQGRPFFH